MEISDSRRRAVFCNLALTCVVLAILSSATATALQPLMLDFGVDASAAGWVTSGYTLALAVTMPLTAYLVTRFAARPLYIAAVGLYLASLVGCACAPAFVALMAARVVGAAANALIASMTQVSIMSIFPKERRGSAMGWFGLSQGAAVVLGPVVGGLAIDALGWRVLFWGGAALCLVSLVWSVACMYVELQTAPRTLDVASFALSVAAFGGVTLGLGNVASCGVASAPVLAPLGVGLAAAALFVPRQLRGEQPFLKLALLRVPVFARAVLMSMALYMVTMGSSAVLPLYVQGCLGKGALEAGLVVMPGALAMAAVAPFAGKLFDRRGIAPPGRRGGRGARALQPGDAPRGRPNAPVGAGRAQRAALSGGGLHPDAHRHLGKQRRGQCRPSARLGPAHLAAQRGRGPGRVGVRRRHGMGGRQRGRERRLPGHGGRLRGNPGVGGMHQQEISKARPLDGRRASTRAFAGQRRTPATPHYSSEQALWNLPRTFPDE